MILLPFSSQCLKMKLTQPDVVAYNTMIVELCREGCFEEAVASYDKKVVAGLCSNEVTYNTLMRGYLKLGNVVGCMEPWK